MKHIHAVRHIAGIPTHKDQRCVRCCEVLVRGPQLYPAWPGSSVVIGNRGQLIRVTSTFDDDCKAVED